MDNDNDNNGGGDGHPFADNLVVLLIAMGSAAFVVSIYHLLAICLYNHPFSTNQNQNQQPRPAASTQPNHDHNSSSSLAQLIPTHKYHKKKKIDGDDDEGGDGGSSSTCAVCLGDFEEGEELRTLPECMHSFHMPCIDMWLHSHTSCPICRASATPSPAMLQHGPPMLDIIGSSVGVHHLNNNPNHTINMMQISLVERIV